MPLVYYSLPIVNVFVLCVLGHVVTTKDRTELFITSSVIAFAWPIRSMNALNSIHNLPKQCVRQWGHSLITETHSYYIASNG